MSLVEHIRELRNRMAKSFLAILVGVVVVFVLWEPVFDVIKAPYCRTDAGEGDCALYSLKVFDQLQVRLRVSFIVGILAASPIWFYQLGAFITPALHRKEKKWAAGFLVCSLSLFGLGVAFAYLTIDRGLQFLLTVGGDGIVVLPSIESYLSFVTLTLLAFGVAFEFPVIIMFLHLVGVLPADRMRAWRRGMIVGIAAASAILTPSTDPFTFVAMALPLYLFYEGCILFARLRERRRRKRELAEGLAGLDDDAASYVDTAPSKL